MSTCSLRIMATLSTLSAIPLAAQDASVSKSGASEILIHFACDYAFPHCGITSNRFLNSTDSEILHYSASSQEAAAFLGLSDRQIHAVMQTDRGDRIDVKDEEDLRRMLSDEQWFKVECIALYIDGCDRLDRPQMRAYLHLSDASISRIRHLRDQYARGSVGPLNSSYFGSDGSDEARASFVVAATKLNVRFNLDVIAAIEPQEKERLERLITQTKKSQLLSAKVREARYRYAEGLSKRTLLGTSH